VGIITVHENLENLQDIVESAEVQQRYNFIRGDIGNAPLVNQLMASGIDAVVNFAAESHVDRSIDNAGIFIKTNVLGTQVVSNAILKHKRSVERFIHISELRDFSVPQ
jgi:dTDP-glucose 4,6-dehydratase